MTDKMKEDFEAWFISKFGSVSINLHGNGYSGQAATEQSTAKIAELKARIDELVEALEGLLSANKITHSTQAPDTVMSAELQLDKIRLAVNKANEVIAKVKDVK